MPSSRAKRDLFLHRFPWRCIAYLHEASAVLGCSLLAILPPTVIQLPVRDAVLCTKRRCGLGPFVILLYQRKHLFCRTFALHHAIRGLGSHVYGQAPQNLSPNQDAVYRTLTECYLLTNFESVLLRTDNLFYSAASRHALGFWPCDGIACRGTV